MAIMSKAWCEEHDVDRERRVRQGRELRAAQCDGHRPVPPGIARAGPQDGAGAEPRLVGQARAQPRPRRIQRIGNASTRVAALLSGEMDMIYSVPPQDMDRIGSAAGIRLIQGPELRTIYLAMDRSATSSCSPASRARIRSRMRGCGAPSRWRSRRTRSPSASARHGPPDLADVRAGGQRLRRGARQRPAVDIAKAKALLKDAGYPDGFQITLDCPNDRYVMDEQICTAISSMLARIGIKVDVYAQPRSSTSPMSAIRTTSSASR